MNKAKRTPDVKARQSNPALAALRRLEKSLTLKQVPNDKQRAWARAVADGVARGELPHSATERVGIASILRAWADQPNAAEPKKRGNPNFTTNRKLPDGPDVAAEVAFRIAFGETRPNAIGTVADEYGASTSAVTKAFDEHGEAFARSFIAPERLPRVLSAIRRK